MTKHTALAVIVSAVVLSALAWIDPIYLPLITLGPIVSGLLAGAMGVEARHVALTWFGASLLVLVTDLALTGEDVAFHAGVALTTAALGAGAAALGGRLRRRDTAHA